MAGQSLKLDETDEPMAFFAGWLAEAEASEPNDPNAMALATVDPSGLPDVRMVLLKGHDARGFVFYTNFESVKGAEILASGKVALCLHWKSLRRQVRARGPVEQVTPAEADAYFASRHPASRRGAWASQQSRPLDSRQTLEGRLAEIQTLYPDDDAIPRPPHWSGFRIVPSEIEFWQDGAHRLHDRFRFTRGEAAQPWKVQRLYP
ncbi:pyridoxamine 5'-phosphate oxidase [Aureimonas mangrovi]|uniref:pyridoxamine 5'-phosphate oxidase n=1 Tax=Aureimonas mangrovi TaxID=2758041 RepID=UPI00163D456E|nr:pyridoxamine 5'-phosphate oxidase [Aureimonas mangrovi]